MQGSRTAKVKIDARKVNRIISLAREIVDLSWQLAVTGIVPGKPPKPKHELLARITNGAYETLHAARRLR